MGWIGIFFGCTGAIGVTGAMGATGAAGIKGGTDPTLGGGGGNLETTGFAAAIGVAGVTPTSVVVDFWIKV